MLHLLNEKIRQEESNGDRYYLIPYLQSCPFPEGVTKLRFPSVTTLLSKVQDKSGLERWRKAVGQKTADKICRDAAIRGTAIHSALEHLLTRRPVPEKHYQYWEFVEQALPFISLVVPKLTEQKIYWYENPEIGYAGTLDLLGEINFGYLRDFNSKTNFPAQSHHVLVDYKTWRKPKTPDLLVPYYIQLAAYSGAINFLTNRYYGVNKAILIGLTKTNYYIYYLSPLEMMFYWNTWRDILNHYFRDMPFDWNSLLSTVRRLDYFGTRVETNY